MRCTAWPELQKALAIGGNLFYVTAMDRDEKVGYAFLAVVLIGVGVFLAWQTGVIESLYGESEPEVRREPIEPLPAFADLELDMNKVELGRRLYHDGILSGDGSVSCASCHAVEAGGAEPRPTSIGILGQIGPINSPTVLNSSFNVAQFWDGRAEDLVAQAQGPVENPMEMGGSFPVVIERLEGEEWYAERFAANYDDGVTQLNIADAIAEYERSLVTPSPFDAYLAGDDTAISAEAQAGWETFQDVGCMSCHQGAALGGTMFQRMGLVNDYFEERGGELTEADMGRFNHTGEESDRHKFKVPTLRNIALTAPYFHDGHAETLPEAVRTMGHVQLGRDLDDTQVAQIVAFLDTLTGELPEHALLADGEMPPERAYELADPYDLRIASRMEDGQKIVSLKGRVPSEELRDQLVAMASAKFANVESDELTVAPDAGLENPAEFAACLDKVLSALEPLDRGRADFDLKDGAKLDFLGEGSAEAREAANQLLAELPEGFSWKKPITLYDGERAQLCDQNLAALQAESRIEFETGSAQLNAASRELLRSVVGISQECPDAIRVHVEGHTDNVGDPGMNLRLSRRRAASVRDALIRYGLDPHRLLSTGHGENKPVADNETDEGRAENRRIELHLDRA